MLGCIVRPQEPDEFYNEGQKDVVQNSQLVAVITGWIGAFGPIIAVLLKQEVPTPIEYTMSYLSYAFSKDETTETIKDETTETVNVKECSA